MSTAVAATSGTRVAFFPAFFAVVASSTCPSPQRTSKQRRVAERTEKQSHLERMWPHALTKGQATRGCIVEAAHPNAQINELLDAR